ncbi:MAG: polyprenyl synthetase family protein, partial [Actinomycetota bacterium]
VERYLRGTVVSDYPFVTETSRHLVDAGGKRFRPLLTLLASHFGPRPANDGVIKAAVVVELTHLATLYHDDVMDEAQLRRGAPSANARWDNSIAILTGDFLFARASDILADLGPEAVRIQAQTFERLCTGQIREAVGPDDGIDP